MDYPCDGCGRDDCTLGHGCEEWRVWFLSAWERINNYARKIGLMPGKSKPDREFWAYEHPDRVREQRGAYERSM